jgi:hypothetical protein
MGRIHNTAGIEAKRQMAGVFLIWIGSGLTAWIDGLHNVTSSGPHGDRRWFGQELPSRIEHFDVRPSQANMVLERSGFQK